MNIRQHVIRLILAAVIILPGITNAAVTYPALDIANMIGDTGASLTTSTFSINATAFQIVTDGPSNIDIDDQVFNLTSTTGSYDGLTGSFTGTFSMGGTGVDSFLHGGFTITVASLATDMYFNPIASFDMALFSGEVTYSGGSLQGTHAGGTITGALLGGTTINAKLGPVVPVPAAVWLFGSGLIGLIAVARRKTT